jgi:hypothetical protein
VTFSSDGGGKVRAALRAVEGPDKVARLVAGVVERFTAGLAFTRPEVNGAQGLAVWDGDALFGMVAFEVRDGRISHVRAVLNPDKLNFAQRQLTLA